MDKVKDLKGDEYGPLSAIEHFVSKDSMYIDCNIDYARQKGVIKHFPGI